MNKKAVLLVILISITSPLIALNGVCCQYGPNPKDPSAYNYLKRYFVECYCDCADTMKQCLKCGHFREPRLFKQLIVSQKDNVKKITSNIINAPKTMQEAFLFFLKKSKSTEPS